MNKKRIFASLALAGTTVLLLTSCIGSGNHTSPNVTPKPAVSQGTSTTQPSGSAPSSAPRPTVTNFVPKNDPNTAAGYLEFAKVLFPNAQATKSYTKDQVLLGLYTAYLYSQQAENTSYFINGSWAKVGYSQDQVNTIFQNWYTDDAMNQLLSNVNTMKTDTKSSQLVFAAFNFLPVGGSNYTVCAVGAIQCQEAGYPKLTSGMTFKQMDDGRLLVTFTVASRITMTVDGTKGYLPINNEMTLYLTKNDSYKGEAGTYPFLIDGWSNNVNRPGFTS